MKSFFAILLIVFLASCGSQTSINQEKNPPEILTPSEENLAREYEEQESDDQTWDSMSPETQEAIDSVVSDLINTESSIPPRQELTEEFIPQTIEKTTSYNNPKWKVDMNISYVLWEDGTIQSLSVTSPNYRGMKNFNKQVQAVIGMTEQEASEFYVSGSSLTNPAFQAAMKQD